jgi:hypothetical protein
MIKSASPLSAFPIIFMLGKQKLKVANQIGGRAMHADAAESVARGYLFVIVVIGLVARVMSGHLGVDAVTSLCILWFPVKGGRKAWAGGSARPRRECAIQHGWQ